MDKFEIIKKNKAPKDLRFANYLIDNFIFLLLYIFIGVLFFIKDEMYMNSIFYNNEIVIGFYYVLYMFLLEVLFKGRSLGKFITRTKVITLHGGVPTKRQYLARSLIRIIPFEPFSFFREVGGSHDLWTNTRVVKAQSFDQDIEYFISIDSIGEKKHQRDSL
ncbi:RDD family protein [Apibacter muscae]|uniref:RDD family protein n=1 Tax=Apibacter muscae TaxID=2509004 RepID=UPI0011AB99D9|nr:RDD family protein [Apibacter muscae]TWP31035.1 RDD family protein [Apibacter muscae]